MDRLAAEWGSGLDQLEAVLDALPYLVVLVTWIPFLSGLRQAAPPKTRFHLLLFLHFAPAPILFACSERELWQFLRWVALGGVALVIGLPHCYWDEGERLRPRIVTALLVVAALGGATAWRLHHVG